MVANGAEYVELNDDGKFFDLEWVKVRWNECNTTRICTMVYNIGFA